MAGNVARADRSLAVAAQKAPAFPRVSDLSRDREGAVGGCTSLRNGKELWLKYERMK